MMDYQALSFWLDAAQWVCIVGVAVWGYLRGKDSENTVAIAAVSKQLQRLDQTVTKQHQEDSVRVARLEERVLHMPTDEDLTEVAGEVKEVAARVQGMEDLLKRIEHQTNLIHQHLLTAVR